MKTVTIILSLVVLCLFAFWNPFFLIPHKTDENHGPKKEIWKTIKLGTGLNIGDDFGHELKRGGFDISEEAYYMLNDPFFKVAIKETELDLVKFTVAELGFKNGAATEDINKCAEVLGLGLCPPEVGPQLRLQYKDQPKDEQIVIGMRPLIDSRGRRWHFLITNYNSKLIDGNYDYPDKLFHLWNPNDCWVFVLPSK